MQEWRLRKSEVGHLGVVAAGAPGIRYRLSKNLIQSIESFHVSDPGRSI